MKTSSSSSVAVGVGGVRAPSSGGVWCPSGELGGVSLTEDVLGRPPCDLPLCDFMADKHHSGMNGGGLKNERYS